MRNLVVHQDARYELPTMNTAAKPTAKKSS
nr:MAG TPA: hypothetical protein [Inoviridae sp.]